jgi:hypothetical protein
VSENEAGSRRDMTTTESAKISVSNGSEKIVPRGCVGGSVALRGRPPSRARPGNSAAGLAKHGERHRGASWSTQRKAVALPGSGATLPEVPQLTAESDTVRGTHPCQNRPYHARNTTRSGLTKRRPQELRGAVSDPACRPPVRIAGGARLGVDRTTSPHRQDPRGVGKAGRGFRSDRCHRQLAGRALSEAEVRVTPRRVLVGATRPLG